MKLLVEVKFTVEVDVDYSLEEAKFRIEESGCPATGIIGKKVIEIINSNGNTCWGCNHGRKNRIIMWSPV